MAASSVVQRTVLMAAKKVTGVRHFQKVLHQILALKPNPTSHSTYLKHSSKILKLKIHCNITAVFRIFDLRTQISPLFTPYLYPPLTTTLLPTCFHLQNESLWRNIWVRVAEFLSINHEVRRSRWPRGLWRRSAAVRLLDCRFESHRDNGYRCLLWVLCVVR